MRKKRLVKTVFAGLAWFCLVAPPFAAQAGPQIINDVSQLNPIRVADVITPHSIAEIQEAVKSHPGPISIGGAHHSMGGQIATEDALFLDMRQFNRVIRFDTDEKTITVEPGITWRQIQSVIDVKNLSVEIMQTYANFTVGGSLSVNVHGRYIGQGPMVRSVRSIKLVLADGSLVQCSPSEHPDLFYAAIGGYGGIGVIVEATLELTDNVHVERRAKTVPVTQYRHFFFEEIRDDHTAVFHNGDIYPPAYDTVNSVTWYQTDKRVTIPERLIPEDQNYRIEPRLISLVAEVPGGLWLRQHVIDPYIYHDHRVEWRNYEASYDARELEPASREKSTYVLQEYFVPVEHFDEFVPKMRTIFQQHHANILNVSIRHALPDPGTLLAWARSEVFCFVVYYKQGVTPEDRAAVAQWTREMIDADISVGGAYYLPYQVVATNTQFHKAYPRADEFFAVKAQVDPQNKFRNTLLNRYYPQEQAQIRDLVMNLKGYQRAEQDTYLTMPEWFIVFNPEEYAHHLKDKPPSSFPYFSSIAEFWHLYGQAYDQTHHRYATDWGSHLMLMVIGSSFSVEYAVKGLYENTMGRLSEWSSDNEPTQEDALIREINEDYIRFIYVYPWYDYPFWSKLRDFWHQVHWQGSHRFRKVERRFFFSAEYLFKAGYGWLVGKGTHMIYDDDPGIIYAIVDKLPADAQGWDPNLQIVKRYEDGQAVIGAPRYEPFRQVAQTLAAHGVGFQEIAGNHEILLTIVAPKSGGYGLGESQIIFHSALATDASSERLGVKTDVKELSPLLNALASQHLRLEHLYDY
jgi:FAD/FMN-containing dehydrogenase